MPPALPKVGSNAAGDIDTELMPAIRRVIAYSGLPFDGVMELPYDLYLLMLKNAIVDEYRATPEGRKFLETCERLKCLEPDVAAAKKSGLMK